MGRKVCLSLLTMASNVLPLHLKQTFPHIFRISIEDEVMGLNADYLLKDFLIYPGGWKYQTNTYFLFFIKFNLISNLPIVHLRKDKEAAKQVLLTDFRRDFQFSNVHLLYIFVCFLFNSFELDFFAQIQIKSYLISHSSPLKDKEAEKFYSPISVVISSCGSRARSDSSPHFWRHWTSLTKLLPLPLHPP